MDGTPATGVLVELWDTRVFRFSLLCSGRDVGVSAHPCCTASLTVPCVVVGIAFAHRTCTASCLRVMLKCSSSSAVRTRLLEVSVLGRLQILAAGWVPPLFGPRSVLVARARGRAYRDAICATVLEHCSCSFGVPVQNETLPTSVFATLECLQQLAYSTRAAHCKARCHNAPSERP